MSSLGQAIDAKQLVKEFDGFRAVNGVDLSISYSEIFGLLGPNGAGKTTTIRMLTGILKPTKGKATVIGLDCNVDSLKLREKVGLLTETPSLYERLTVRQNLEFFAEIYSVPKNEIGQRIKSLAELFEISEKLDSTAGTLSKGMKQKVAIARSMIHDPEVLFFDEPTASLSPESAKVVRELILKLAKERNRTVFIATHNLTEAERLCDRVGIINNGRLVAVGKPEDLRSNMTGETTTIIRFLEWNDRINSFFNEEGISIIKENKDEKTVEIKLSDYIKDSVKLLNNLIKNGFAITEFYHNKPSLESIYLDLVQEEGDVNNND